MVAFVEGNLRVHYQEAPSLLSCMLLHHERDDVNIAFYPAHQSTRETVLPHHLLRLVSGYIE